MLKKIAIGCNALVFLLLSYLVISKGFPPRSPDNIMVLLVFASAITSFLSLTGILNKK